MTISHRLPTRTRPPFGPLLSVVLALISSAPVSGQRLVTQQEAAKVGLHRAWYGIVTVDPGRGRLLNVLVDGDMFFALTDVGLLHAFDAATGATRWTISIGSPILLSMGPAANADFVALLNGSTLYTVSRRTGKVEQEWVLSGAPGAGPCLTEDHIFVPLSSGAFEARSLAKPDEPPWRYQGVGRCFVRPIATARNVFWPTDRGYLYAARADGSTVDFRLETNDAITTVPAYASPMVYAASLDGYLYSVEEGSGNQRWRYSVGEPIEVAPAAVLGRVFVCSQSPTMFCLDAELGQLLWQAERVQHFVAASPSRVYGAGTFNHVYVLDLQSGERLGVLRTDGMTLPISNQKTDRIYLASPTGMIQCLHEIGSTTPVDHLKAETAGDEDAKTGDAADETPGAAEGGEDDNPFDDVEEEGETE